jgi:hypothetical protein
LVALVGLTGAWVIYQTRDRHPGYSVDLHLRASPDGSQTPQLSVGFGRERITPDLGRTVWLAGFATGRRGTAVHDDLWAVAMVIDDGSRRLGVVALDSIGLFHDDVIAIRRRVEARVRLDYLIVTATHNHSTPDLMGLWGPRTGFSGVDDRYRAFVIDRAVAAVVTAANATSPARLALYEIPLQPVGLVADSRDPQVFDSTLRMMHVTSVVDGSTLGSLVNWADHPETPWSANTEITADFPGYLRDLLEHGVNESVGVAAGGPPTVSGLGGIHLYVNGAIGGLMTTNPETAVTDPYSGQSYSAPSHDKARALGRVLGRAILSALAERPADPEPSPRLSIAANTLELPVDNTLFRLALAAGVVDRGQPHMNRIRSEVALITLGDASIATIPGELYPEIANGGIVQPPGADFTIDPIEIPPLRELMPGRVTFLFGLANDAIGYIIPKSEWDDQAPWLYGARERHYGEEVSLGPETGPLIHEAVRRLIEER